MMITMFEVVSAALERQHTQTVFATHLPDPGQMCVGCARMGQARQWPCMHAEAARVGDSLCKRKIDDINRHVVEHMIGAMV